MNRASTIALALTSALLIGLGCTQPGTSASTAGAPAAADAPRAVPMRSRPAVDAPIVPRPQMLDHVDLELEHGVVVGTQVSLTAPLLEPMTGERVSVLMVAADVHLSGVRLSRSLLHGPVRLDDDEPMRLLVGAHDTTVAHHSAAQCLGLVDAGGQPTVTAKDPVREVGEFWLVVRPPEGLAWGEVDAAGGLSVELEPYER